jgi:hypothetical protein
MLMERALEFPILRAPQGDCQTLIAPAWPVLPQVVGRNREQLAGVQYDVQGRSLADLSAAARRHLVQFAAAYTGQYRGVPECWQASERLSGVPFILSGHQPELFHPGVWYKNFVLGGLARRTRGVGIHLLIDSDLCRGASIRVPTGSVELPRMEAVSYDKPAVEVPFEERLIRDSATFSTFAERASGLVRTLVADPLVAQLWPLMMERNQGQTNLGLRLAQGRHALEEMWNNETLELPQSAVCQLPEFAWFVAHLLANLPRFRSAHNEALAMYRRAHHLRNRAHPVPDLASADGWLEAPFWIWTGDDPVRRPLLARRLGSDVEISDRHAQTISLRLSDDGDATMAAEQLAGLASRGIKLRTRALTTTLFARLLLSDLFLHGIGGAKYDQVTDQIVRSFFGFEPPEIATVSATLRLPVDHAARESVAAGQWEQRLRELRYHPEQFVTCDVSDDRRDDCQAAEIVAAKRQWLKTPKTVQNARERHVAIVRANEALQPYVAPLRDRIERERHDIQQHKRREAILRSREYSFCLYPRQHFDKLLAEPRLEAV